VPRVSDHTTSSERPVKSVAYLKHAQLVCERAVCQGVMVYPFVLVFAIRLSFGASASI